MKTDSEKLNDIWEYIQAQKQPVSMQPKEEIYFESYPENLPVMTYLDTVKAVKKINDENSHGHNDWAIPTIEQVRIQYANKDEVNGEKFIIKSDNPSWYWSSTEYRDYPANVHCVRFSDGYEGWDLKDYDRLSCRPVRLIAAVGEED